MNDNEKKSGDWKGIIGGVILIAVLFMGVKFVFWGLDQAIPKSRLTGSVSVSVSASVSPDASALLAGQESPSFCIHCGKALPETFQWGQYCPYCGEKVE